MNGRSSKVLLWASGVFSMRLETEWATSAVQQKHKLSQIHLDEGSGHLSDGLLQTHIFNLLTLTAPEWATQQDVRIQRVKSLLCRLAEKDKWKVFRVRCSNHITLYSFVNLLHETVCIEFVEQVLFFFSVKCFSSHSLILANFEFMVTWQARWNIT